MISTAFRWVMYSKRRAITAGLAAAFTASLLFTMVTSSVLGGLGGVAAGPGPSPVTGTVTSPTQVGIPGAATGDPLRADPTLTVPSGTTPPAMHPAPAPGVSPRDVTDGFFTAWLSATARTASPQDRAEWVTDVTQYTTGALSARLGEPSAYRDVPSATLASLVVSTVDGQVTADVVLSDGSVAVAWLTQAPAGWRVSNLTR